MKKNRFYHNMANTFLWTVLQLIERFEISIKFCIFDIPIKFFVYIIRGFYYHFLETVILNASKMALKRKTDIFKCIFDLNLTTLVFAISAQKLSSMIYKLSLAKYCKDPLTSDLIGQCILDPLTYEVTDKIETPWPELI